MTTATPNTRPDTAELAELRMLATEIRDVAHAVNLMGWDEQTGMPLAGAEDRSASKSMLTGLLHEKMVSDKLLAAIEAVESTDADDVEARRMRRSYESASCLPTDFVRERSEVTSAARHAWQEARSEDDFSIFQPHLEKVVDLALREAEYRGYDAEPYDALVDQYEEGITAADLTPVFDTLRAPSRELLDRMSEPDWSLLKADYDSDVQRRLAPHFAEAVGFDMERGRIDDTTHPFCATIGRGDVRLTARYLSDWLPGGIFAVMHEAGHGVYEQGVQSANLPATLASSAGLGTHESQSRMYENIVGRSLSFWQHHYGTLQEAFPAQLGNVDVETFHRAINTSQATTIRVEADELTYNLHIGLRYELERALMNRDLAVADLPDAWNAKMEEWLGITPPNNAEGCLQDVHWSYGAIGYFPTYTLGNVYAAQYMMAMEQDIPGWEDGLASGNVAPINEWFQRNIYDHGDSYTGQELVKRATGQDLNAQPLVDYLQAKFGPLAG